ncbi:PhnJ, carbon-phosphorus lyase complex subunit [Pseudomonas cannabina]|uniref:PhnJ, carbon-phosphorus lyase complex subunit n=1 Tax=Pseudomonas cannabina TaxID=86840 RepID=A0AB37Q532_PSECA|nr:PhnJ, carbon-phosphorus lyase complex subunit [Pseudomonas cannabina]
MLFDALCAVVGVGTDKALGPGVIENQFVEERIVAAADGTALLPALHFKRMVFKVEAHHLGERRHGVQTFFASGTEQHQRRAHVQLGVVEFRNRRWVHHITLIDHHRVGVAGGDMAEGRDVLVEFDVHDAVIIQRVHGAGFGFRGFDEPQRLGDRHLINHDLIGVQGCFRNPVTGLDHRGFRGTLGGGNACGAGEKTPDRHRIGGVVSALVDDFQHVIVTQNRGGQLHAPRPPAIRQRHFAPAEWHLVTGNRDRFEQRAANHAFGLFVQISEVVGLIPCRPLRFGAHGCSTHWSLSGFGADLRSLRISSSSDWKST